MAYMTGANRNILAVTLTLAGAGHASAALTGKVDSIRGIEGCYEAAAGMDDLDNLEFHKIIVKQTHLSTLGAPSVCENSGIGWCGADVTLVAASGEIWQEYSASMIAQNPAFGSAAIGSKETSGPKAIFLAIVQADYVGETKDVRGMVLAKISAPRFGPGREFRRCAD